MRRSCRVVLRVATKSCFSRRRRMYQLIQPVARTSHMDQLAQRPPTMDNQSQASGQIDAPNARAVASHPFHMDLVEYGRAKAVEWAYRLKSSISHGSGPINTGLKKVS